MLKEREKQRVSGTEVLQRSSLDRILYAQCWEDADVLLEGLDLRPGDVCLSVASAGDNTLALLTRDPRRVIAVDIDPAQLACLEIRVAAMRKLTRGEFLELMGSRPSHRRGDLYRKCRAEIESPHALELWDQLVPRLVKFGVGGVGTFENYWRIFRRYVLPLVHRQKVVKELLAPKSASARRHFYDRCWNTWRWRTVARVFASRRILSWLGREPAFFEYASQSSAEHFLETAARGLTELSPADNPFLHWILTGQHGAVLPVAYRPEHFQRIRENLPRLEWRQCSVEQAAEEFAELGLTFDGFNLSDIFEYMSVDNQHAALKGLLRASHRGSRMVFWNMIVPRPIPADLADRIVPLGDVVIELRARDTGFFYRSLNVAEVQ